MRSGKNMQINETDNAMPKENQNGKCTGWIWPFIFLFAIWTAALPIVAKIANATAIMYIVLSTVDLSLFSFEIFVIVTPINAPIKQIMLKRVTDSDKIK